MEDHVRQVVDYKLDVARRKLWVSDPTAFVMASMSLPTKSLVEFADRLLRDPMWAMGMLASVFTKTSLPDRELLRLVRRVGWLRNWAWDGFCIYDLDAKLALDLLHTEPDKVTNVWDINAPFGAFRIQIPDVPGGEPLFPMLGFEDTLLAGNNIDVRRVYLREPDSWECTLFHAAGIPYEGRVAQLNDMIATPDDPVVGSVPAQWLLMLLSNSPYSVGELYNDLGEPLQPEMTPAQASGAGRTDMGGWDDPMEKAAMDHATLLAFNLVQLIVDRVLEPRAKSVPGKRGRGPVARPTRFVFRTTKAKIKLDRNMVEAAKDLTYGRARPSAYRELRMRHRVRGHHRLQPYGPGRGSVKRIWIAPYWKGPEDIEEGWARRTVMTKGAR